jgi:23S rRNA G2445 N2-methylase RlmL
MKVAILCDYGFEKEISKAILVPTKNIIIGKGHVLCDIDNKEDIISLYYRFQGALRILVDVVTGKNVKDVSKKFSPPSWWKPNGTFKVRAYEFDDNQETAGDIGKNIDFSVNLDDPDVLVIVKKCEDVVLCGIDIAQIPLQKREYRIYTNPAMIRSTVAFGMLQYAGYDKEKALLDPFCGSGTVLIEAALFATGTSSHKYRKHDFKIPQSGFANENTMNEVFEKHDALQEIKKLPIYGYDHLLKRVRASNHNGKIAGILDALKFSRVDIDWLDTKIDDKSIDCIVTQPPLISQFNLSRTEKTYEEFFDQAKNILKKNGVIVIATNHDKPVLAIAKRHGFSIEASKVVIVGDEKYSIIKIRN